MPEVVLQPKYPNTQIYLGLGLGFGYLGFGFFGIWVWVATFGIWVFRYLGLGGHIWDLGFLVFGFGLQHLGFGFGFGWQHLGFGSNIWANVWVFGFSAIICPKCLYICPNTYTFGPNISTFVQILVAQMKFLSDVNYCFVW